MLDTFKTMFFGFLKMLKYPLIFILILFGMFGLVCLVYLIIGYAKGRRPNPTSVKRVLRPNFLYSVFVLTPKQFIDDYFNKPSDFFQPQGLVIFTGAQGRGKTVALVEYMLHLQKCYPKSKCITNLNYAHEDDRLMHWKQLIDYKNGHKGVIVGMDELQNWFSCSQSKNFPPEMLGVITQNRKNRRVILGTAQNFHLLAKAIRGQCTEVRECMTFLGCFTLIRRREPVIDEKGDVAEWKNRGFYFFVHTKEIRDSYDTYKVIEAISESGFIDRPTFMEE